MSRFFPTSLLCGLMFLFATTTLCAQKKEATLRVEPTEVQLGEIEIRKIDDTTGRVKIAVWNDGTAPLILQNVSGCCGTDIKDYTRAPILPGKEGEIQVYFRVEPKLHTISRTVTILSNDPKNKEVFVPIKGTVVKNKELGRVAF